MQIKYTAPDHDQVSVHLDDGKIKFGPADLNRWPEHLREQVQAYLAGGGTIEEYQEPSEVRIGAIKQLTKDRIGKHLLGDESDRTGEAIQQAALSVSELVDVLKAKGLITDDDLSDEIKTPNAKMAAVRQARQAAKQAVINGDDLATFQATLDMIIPKT